MCCGGLAGVTFVCCGDNHSAAITANEVYTWGLGRNGQLGHGEARNNEPVPRSVESLKGAGIVDGACGSWHSILRSSSGRIFVFGSVS